MRVLTAVLVVFLYLGGLPLPLPAQTNAPPKKDFPLPLLEEGPGRPRLPVLRGAMKLKPAEARRLRNLFKNADVYYDLGDMDNLEALLEELKKNYPESPDPFLYQAHVRMDQQRFAEAGSLARTALNLDPQSLWACKYLGICHEKQAMWNKARGVYEQAAVIDPEDHFVQQQLGLINHRLGFDERAAGHFLRVLADRPNDGRMHLNVGMVFYEMQEYARALKHLERAALLNPTSATTQHWLGLARLVSGQLEPAIAAFREAIRIEPGNLDARSNLAGALLQEGRLDEAIRTVLALLQAQPNHEAGWNNLLFALERRFASGSKRVGDDRLSGRWHAERAVEAEAAGRPADACFHLLRAVASQPAQPEYFDALGSWLLAREEARLSEQFFRASLRIDPGYAPARANLALVARAGEISALQQRLSVDPQDASANREMGFRLAETGQFERALPYLRQAFALEPDVPLGVVLAKALSFTGRPAESVALFKKVLIRAPGQPALQHRLAWLILEQDLPLSSDLTLAVSQAEKANLQTGMKNIEYLHTLARAYALSRDETKARQTAQQALEQASAQSDAAWEARIRKDLARYL